MTGWRYILVGVSVLIAMAVYPASVEAVSWPTLRRNQTNQNSVSEQPQLPLVKQGNLPYYVSQPVVQGGLVVIVESGAFGQRVAAYRLSTMESIWQYPLGSLNPRQLMIHNGTVYFGLIGVPEVYALSLATGAKRWHVRLPGETASVRFSPLVIGDSIFVAARSLHQLSVDGVWRWSKTYDVEFPLATDGEALFFRTHHLQLIRMRVSGEIEWVTSIGSTRGSEPLVVDQSVYVGTTSRVFAFDKVTGTRRWFYDILPTASTVGALAAAGTQLFAASDNGTIIALNSSGQLLWSTLINGNEINGNGWQPQFIFAGDRLIARSSPTETTVVDALSGSILQVFSLSSTDLTPRVVADRRILFSDRESIHIFTASAWSEGVLADPNPEKLIDPVVVVPGLLGSWRVAGQWKIDPILKTYDQLIEALELAGYQEGQTLFTFPYDWRQSSVLVAEDLRQRIGQIRQQTGSPKVDVVAHSLGGLIARSYVVSDQYVNDIDELITIATPHHGSIKAYLAWEAAEVGTNLLDRLQEQFIRFEAFRSGYGLNSLAYIRQQVLSIAELLPTFNYLQRSDQLMTYSPCLLDIYPCNRFIETLRQQHDRYLTRVQSHNIIGQTDTPTTLARLSVTDSINPDLWQHGMPLQYPASDGLMYGEGDDTVLSSSAHLDGVDETVVAANHRSVVSQSASQVVKLLTQQEITLTPQLLPDRFLFLRLFSSNNILVIDSNGNRLGIDPQTGQMVSEIPGAYYEDQTNGDYVIIPEPVESPYKVSVSTEQAGGFTLEGSLSDEEETVEAAPLTQTEQSTNQVEVRVEPESVIIAPATPDPCITTSPSSVVIAPPKAFRLFSSLIQ